MLKTSGGWRSTQEIKVRNVLKLILRDVCEALGGGGGVVAGKAGAGSFTEVGTRQVNQARHIIRRNVKSRLLS